MIKFIVLTIMFYLFNLNLFYILISYIWIRLFKTSKKKKVERFVESQKVPMDKFINDNLLDLDGLDLFLELII